MLRTNFPEVNHYCKYNSLKILVWNKVKESLSQAGDKISEQTKALIEKYKPKIQDALQRVQKVIIEEGKRIVIEIINDIVKVTVGSLENNVALFKRSVFTDCKFDYSINMKKLITIFPVCSKIHLKILFAMHISSVN